MSDRIVEEGTLGEPLDEEAGRRRRLVRSTAIFSVATGLSRALGLLREVVAASIFGTVGQINAFTMAFQIPNLVRALVADAALSSAFVPVFSELLEKGERKRAWRVASTLFWLLLLALTAVTALFILIAPFLMPLLTDAYDDLTVQLSQILFPVVALLGVSGIVVGILNSYDEFSIPALTPVFWNVAIIAGLVIGVPLADSTETELYIYAGSIVLGTIIQVALPFPWLRGRDDRLRLAIDIRDPAVWQVFKLMGPVTLGLGLINVNAVIGMVFASKLIDPEQAPTAIDKAFRIYMLPQGMFSVAVATVLFPALSRLATRGETEGFKQTISGGVRQIAFLLVPASVTCAVLAEPITRIIYERGDFDPSQTPVVAGALAAFALGLSFNGMMLMLNRGFFSLQAPWTPTVVALLNLVLNTVLYYALYRVGTWGIPLAISLANIAGVAMLVFFLRHRIGRLGLSATAGSIARITAASVLLAAVAFGVWVGLDELLGRSFIGQVVSLGGALTVGGLVYLLACRALRVRELSTALSLLHRRP